MSLSGPQPEDPQRSPSRDVLLGLALGLGINALVFVVGLFSALSWAPAGWSLIAIGVMQFIYIGPLILEARRSQRPGRVKGPIIAASITLLLNAACGSAFWWPMFRAR